MYKEKLQKKKQQLYGRFAANTMGSFGGFKARFGNVCV